jgi:general secretion pathway protein B
MSFILDALKKSEAERQRQDAPGIANIPQSTERRGGKHWAWIIGGLLAINLVVLLGIVFRPGDGPVTAATPTPTSEPAVATAERAVRPPPATSSAPPESSVSTAPPAQATAAEPAATSTPALPTPEAVSLPTFEALRAQGQLSLPDMHIDIHVYSGRPEDRFVFVNMTKYRENATLTEGPTVVQISPEGVVLDYFGTRFLLPRE